MSPCRYKLAVFDLDGTLLNTGGGIANALSKTLEGLGFYPHQKTDLTAYIGPPIEVAFRELLGLEGPSLDDAAAQFRHRYRTQDLLTATPYHGIFELLEELRRCKINTAVATYKREDYARELLFHFGFDRYMPVIYGSDTKGLLKKSDIIRRCMASSGIADPKEAVMIGDTGEDARGAAGMGVDFIAVTYGFGFQKAEDAAPYKAVGVASTPMEILPYILKGE